MTKRSVILCILSIFLLTYLVVAISWAKKEAKGELCTGVNILVSDTFGTKFVTPEDIAREIKKPVGLQYTQIKLGEINTDAIESALNAIDKIESANCMILSDGLLQIEITPMLPIARFFRNGKSFYINRNGKQITAEGNYHIDVPIVVDESCDSTFTETDLIPLLNYINTDSTWNALVSVIKTTPNHDIIIIPMIRGHVINFGDTTSIQNKFSRLQTMYEKILPEKGWDFYDTLSVKWKGQVVATRKVKKRKEPVIPIDEDYESDDVDLGTMKTTE